MSTRWQQKANIVRRLREHRRDTGGFTLVELIVVLVVLGILCTLSVMGLLGWQDYADFKRNNEAAASIFQAAQIQLTQYGERGQLTELADAVTDSGDAPKSEYLLAAQGTLTGSDGNPVDVKEESDGSIWEQGYSGNIYYLMAEKGDYQTYLQRLQRLSVAESRRLDAGERRIKALFDLIDPYISDKAMMDAAIGIEFDPDPKVGQVYSVFYNDRAEQFSYEDSADGEMVGKTAPIRDRSRETRRKAKTGYYGAETLAKGTDTFIVRPVITNVRLNNEETLNLSWATKGDGGRELTGMIYKIDLYQQEAEATGEGTNVMTITLGKAEPKQLSIQDGRIFANVSLKQEDGSWADAEYCFPITVNTVDSTISLVLDGLDLNADELTVFEELKETASFRRFDLDAEFMYAVVTGSRLGVYDITTKKQSNTEHLYFGDKKAGEDGSVIYTIENARHLNNIRYQEEKHQNEDGAGAPGFTYQVIRDISWEYALNQGAVYQNVVQQFPAGGDITPYYFKPILTLRKNSVLESDTAAGRKLKKFRFDAAHTAGTSSTGAVRAVEESHYLGLIAENHGAINKLVMEDVFVEGVSSVAGGTTVTAEAAGAFCGVNRGNLDGLSVISLSDAVPSRIHGLAYVGGIAGRSVSTYGMNGSYENLVNRANVTGQRYVGGISGSLESGDGTITLKNCANYGKIRGEQVESWKEAYFFGGITGYAGVNSVIDTQAGETGQIVIQNCQSSPYYTEDEVRMLLGSIENPDAVGLVENYMGGIVGFNDTARLIDCNTLQERNGRKGYVIGKDYVGGIAGYNSGKVGLTGGANNRSQVHVIGNSYVGGIVGCNAVGSLLGNADDGYTLQLAAKDGAGPQQAQISGWINEGVITSVGDYAGGITGFNGETGIIENSYSSVEYNVSAENLARVSTAARFAGGVAGYNKGLITNTATDAVETTEPVRVVSVISGKDYVGGIVGCNDVDGEIRRYELDGGYIQGSHFVGGFVGLNLDDSIFSHHIKSNPNKVTGNYFVGGAIGANLAVTNASVLNASFETDNFLGELSADRGAFAGGFIGYNYLLGTAAEDHILPATDILCTMEPLDSVTEEIPETLEQPLKDLLGDYANITTRMEINGDGEAAAQQNLGSVRAKVHVGGIVGYNQPSTQLEIRNAENVTPVEATGYIEREEEGMSVTHRYSYAGGIIGRVSEHVVLDNCRNKDAGEVRGKGTYTGGLAEINYGTIKNCTAGNIGDGTKNYVGGIVGVNADQNALLYEAGTYTVPTAAGNNGRGLLANCVAGGQVSGVSCVGGLAAENYGVIEYTSGESGADGTGTGGTGAGGTGAGNTGTGGFGGTAQVDGSGRYVGGIVGYAHEYGEIRIDGDLALDVDVTGTARYVGGIAGVNAGSIRVLGSGSDYVIENTKDNTIAGRNYVGGFIGLQLEPGDGSDVTLRRFENRARVQSETGFAGGIAALVLGQSSGENNAAQKTDRVKLEQCKNFGTVEVLSGSGADGDDSDEEELLPDDGTGLLPGEEEDFENGFIPDLDEDMTAAAGGITAVNHGVIRSCGNYGQVSASRGYVGGITAVNYHEIKWSETTEREDVNAPDEAADALELTGDSRVGGIAAVNKDGAEIRESAVRSLILRNQSSSEDGCMGGIAAWNEGTIYDCAVGVGLELEELEQLGKATGTGTVSYSELRCEAAGYTGQGMGSYSFRAGGDSEVLGNSVRLISYAPKTNMGGVAGCNEKRIEGTRHSDFDGEFVTVVAADLRFDGDSMNYFGNIGGIAGVNGGEISKYEFSGYVRGLAGDPANTPTYSTAYDLEQNKSRIYGYGGIAGRNGSDISTTNTAEIRECSVGMAKISGTGDGNNRTNVGGIAGFNGMGASITEIRFARMDELDVTGRFEQTVDTKYAHGYHPNLNPPEKITARGTVWVDASNYGHAGGVTGFNHGQISRINWTDRYEKVREVEGYDTVEGIESTGYFPNGKLATAEICDVDATGVLVTSGAGLVGGITGYNRRTGKIDHAVTGRNWLVSALSQQQGNGIGGIIGYNISEQDLEFCDNHAMVYKIADNAVGGITGCQETSTSSSWRYYDCKNYGTLFALNRGGGVIGVWKYKGGTIEECQNYGTVYSLNDSGAGITATVEAVAEGEQLSFVRCENFGDVYTHNSKVRLAGILSYVNDEHGVLDIQISECINTGSLRVNYYDPYAPMTARGGIFATADGDSNVEIRYCRNYGFIRDDSRHYGITRGTNSSLKDEDILADQNLIRELATVKVEHCFGVANGTKAGALEYPIGVTAKDGSVENYYFINNALWAKQGKGFGTQIRIVDDQAGYGNAGWLGLKLGTVVVPDMGGYQTDQIVANEGNGEFRRDSDKNYMLCKGVPGTQGLDIYLRNSLTVKDLNAPVLEESGNIGGEYQVKWEPVDGARYYEVLCEYRKSDGTVLGTKHYTTYTNTAGIPSVYEQGGVRASGVRVSVRACGIAPDGVEAYSPYSNTITISFAMRLPSPQIVWELAKLDGYNCYRIVLNNREEYVSFAKNQLLSGMAETAPDYEKKLEEELKKILIHTTGAEKGFTAWDGAYRNTEGSYSYLEPLVENADSKSITSYAEYTDPMASVGQSVHVVRESQFPGRGHYLLVGSMDGSFANVRIQQTQADTDIGFAGKTAGELAYYMELSPGSLVEPWNIYYRSEIVALDPELGVPVTVSVAEQTPVPTTENQKISVKLSNFPSDFLEKNADGTYKYQNVWVRTYPTTMANDMVMQGWNLSEDTYTAEELANLTVSDSGELLADADDGMPLFEANDGLLRMFSGKSVKAGYVIVRNGQNSKGENLYSVYYNTLLKTAFDGKDPDKDPHYDNPLVQYQNDTRMKYQIFYHRINLAAAINNVQPKPVAFVNAVYGKTGNQTEPTWQNGSKYDELDTLKLTWDQAADGTNPAYPGAEPDADDTQDSKYINAVYRLTLTGTSADGKTTVLVNEKEFTTPNRTGTGYNTYEADSKNWNYTNIHVKLTRVGEVNDKGITVKFPAATEFDLPMRRRLRQATDLKLSLKKNEDGIVIKDALQYDLTFTGVPAEEQAALSGYEIMVRTLDGEAKEETVTVTATEAMPDENGRVQATLDLSSFSRDQKISVTVQAVAAAANTSYRNAIISAAREMTVPARLLPPQMGDPDPTDEVDETNMNSVPVVGNVLSVKEFTDGALTLTMKQEDYGNGTQSKQVDYQIALELYKTAEEAEEGNNPITDKEIVLPAKSDESKVMMDYVSGEGIYTYTISGLPITYAGHYVRVVLRSVGTSDISSVWTDEDDLAVGEDAQKVKSHMVFRLPAVQVDAVDFKELAENTEQKAWTEQTGYQIYENGQPVTDLDNDKISVSQRWVQFDTVEYADEYQITMIQTPQQADKKATTQSSYQVSDVNWLSLKKTAENEYELNYRSTERLVAADGTVNGTDEEWSETLTVDGTEVAIPYLEEIQVTETQTYYIQSQAKVKLEYRQNQNLETGVGDNRNQVTVSILLPDCRIENSLHMRTEQILVQSVAIQETGREDDYLDSRWALVIWDDNDLKQQDDIELIESAVEPKYVDSDAAQIKEFNNILYTVGLTGTTRYVVSVMDSSGDELEVMGVPVFDSTSVDMMAQQVWLEADYKHYAGQRIKLKFQSIFDPTSEQKGGLSEAFTGAYEVLIPGVQTQSDEPLVLTRMADPTQYTVNLTQENLLLGVKKRRAAGTLESYQITAAQKQLVWDYDLTDTTIAGYDLKLSGSQMEDAYTEQMDLHRGLFGAMPGLKEYLEPGGKLLYTVDYHVDGELALQFGKEDPLASDSNAVEDSADEGNTDAGMASPSNTAMVIPSYAAASQSDMATLSDLASPSDTASDSNSGRKPDVLTLECRLQAEYLETDGEKTAIRFTLTLPDLSFDWMQEEAVELYQRAFMDGLYQTEGFRLTPVMSDRVYEATETVLDLIEMRGELMND